MDIAVEEISATFCGIELSGFENLGSLIIIENFILMVKVITHTNCLTVLLYQYTRPTKDVHVTRDYVLSPCDHKEAPLFDLLTDYI